MPRNQVPLEDASRRRSLHLDFFWLLLSAVLLYLPAEAQALLAGAVRFTLLRPFLEVQAGVVRVRVLMEETTRIQARMDSLAALVVAQGTVEEENRRLRALLGVSPAMRVGFVPARVVRPGTPGSESVFLLDVGRQHGVSAGDPVVMREGRIGLAGLVREVSRSSAVGIDWSHPDFRASAMTWDGKVFGLVEPVRGTFREEDRLLLNGVPFYERVDPGTLIVTSGLGGVFPRGIPIGTVQELAEEEGGWRKSYWLRPLVQPGSLVHVLVLREDPLARRLLEDLLRADSAVSADTLPPAPMGPAGPEGSPGGGGV